MAEPKASYKSDAGGVIESFAYKDVSKSKEKLSTTYEFSNTNQTYVQTLGSTMLRLPLEMIFTSSEYLKEAAEAFKILGSSSYGTLTHPLYGDINVAVVGKITKEDNLLTGIGSSIITVTFYESIKKAYPAISIDARSSILEKQALLNNAAAEQVSTTINLTNQADAASWKTNLQNAIKQTKKRVGTIIDGTQAISSEISIVQRSVESNIEAIAGGAIDAVGQLLTIGKQVQIFIQLPARLKISIVDRANAFIDNLNSLLGLSSKPDLVTNTNKNNFANADLQATATIAALAEATITDTEFTTQQQAIEYIDILLNQTENYIAWRETQYTNLALADDDYQTYQQLQELINLTAGYLLDLSFTLKQQKTFVCNKDYSVVELASILYSSTEFEQQIITDNKLIGDDLFFVNKGKEVIYYA